MIYQVLSGLNKFTLLLQITPPKDQHKLFITCAQLSHYFSTTYIIVNGLQGKLIYKSIDLWSILIFMHMDDMIMDPLPWSGTHAISHFFFIREKFGSKIGLIREQGNS